MLRSAMWVKTDTEGKHMVMCQSNLKDFRCNASMNYEREQNEK